MPPKTTEPKAPLAWKVIGGADKGGITVREGVNLKSKELPEKLATGTVVQELELQGERLRYKRLRGEGPLTGWVSTKTKEKDLLVRHTLRVWIMTAGTRGDLQPYLALGVGLHKAGFDVSVWSCEDYRKFVESYDLPFYDISPSCEEFVKAQTGVQDKSLNTKDVLGKEDVDDDTSTAQIYAARWILSSLYGMPINGVTTDDGYDDNIGWSAPLVGTLASGMLARYFAAHIDNTLRPIGALFEGLRVKLEAWSLAKEADKAEKTAQGEEGTLEEEDDLPPSVPAVPEDQTDPDTEAYWVGYRKSVIRTLKAHKKKGLSLIPFGLPTQFLSFLADNQHMVDGLLGMLESSPPDLVLTNFAYTQLALHFEWKYGIPHIHLVLQPNGLHMTELNAPWVTKESWPLLQQLEPALYQYNSLEQAQQEYVTTCAPERTALESGRVAEALLTEPIFGNSPHRDMTLAEFHRRTNDYPLVGFLTAVSTKRFLGFMGDLTRLDMEKMNYTGFWILEDKAQTSGPAAMFGGPELLKTMEDFIAKGSKPAYIGWGSCVAAMGRAWMCLVAVAGLQCAGMRGIVLSGWANLSYALLEEIAGPSDEAGLCAYARENILFIDRAPQNWLFPKCSVIVIHGGVGTLAVAWQSGVPLIILPVWLDQFPNGFLNILMGSGLLLPALDACTPFQLAEALRSSAQSKEMQVGAQAVQLSMMRDNGIHTAVNYISSFLTEDVPSGEWLDRWKREDPPPAKLAPTTPTSPSK
mmetsp:Transcript_10788/g.24358  ORF Transcript_10788/g.24358 Transcript_10788/m.24358 type:complete len:751 (+) Transcript_10788:43-2295(+)